MKSMKKRLATMVTLFVMVAMAISIIPTTATSAKAKKKVKKARFATVYSNQKKIKVRADNPGYKTGYMIKPGYKVKLAVGNKTNGFTKYKKKVKKKTRAITFKLKAKAGYGNKVRVKVYNKKGKLVAKRTRKVKKVTYKVETVGGYTEYDVIGTTVPGYKVTATVNGVTVEGEAYESNVAALSKYNGGFALHFTEDNPIGNNTVTIKFYNKKGKLVQTTKRKATYKDEIDINDFCKAGISNYGAVGKDYWHALGGYAYYNEDGSVNNAAKFTAKNGVTVYMNVAPPLETTTAAEIRSSTYLPASLTVPTTTDYTYKITSGKTLTLLGSEFVESGEANEFTTEGCLYYFAVGYKNGKRVFVKSGSVRLIYLEAGKWFD